MTGITEPAVPERVIAELPASGSLGWSPFPSSGACHWSSGQWLVVVNGSEPLTRQRFSLAHELKHIIDHRFAHSSTATSPKRERAAMIEQICDDFGRLLADASTMGEASVVLANSILTGAGSNIRCIASRHVRPHKTDWPNRPHSPLFRTPSGLDPSGNPGHRDSADVRAPSTSNHELEKDRKGEIDATNHDHQDQTGGRARTPRYRL